MSFQRSSVLSQLDTSWWVVVICIVVSGVLQGLLHNVAWVAATETLKGSRRSNPLIPPLTGYPVSIPSRPGPGKQACAALLKSGAFSKTLFFSDTTQYQSSLGGHWNSLNNQLQASCVLRPEDAQDVSAALKIIRSVDGAMLAIKAGGHNPNLGFSATDGGVLIDMGGMQDISYDKSKGLVSYQPGPVFGDIYKALEKDGVAVTGARLGGVGTGLNLGGGLSYLSGEYGLAADGWDSLEVVLPSGEIVTASKNENPDLFFAMKGAGNAFGVVTRYTVQARPMPAQIWGGVIVYALSESDQLLPVIENFARYNKDPKAAVIPTFLELPPPSVFLNLGELGVMFISYHGTDPGDVFKNFTDVAHVMADLGLRSYYNLTTNEDGILSDSHYSNGVNTLRVSAHRVTDPQTGADIHSVTQAYQAWKAWKDAHQAIIGPFMTQLAIQPISRMITDASRATGGNAMQLPDGPWIWIEWGLFETYPTLGLDLDPTANATFYSFRDLVNSQKNAVGLPLFTNDASRDQNHLMTWSKYAEVKETKEKYDPQGWWSNATVGWNWPK